MSVVRIDGTPLPHVLRRLLTSRAAVFIDAPTQGIDGGTLGCKARGALRRFAAQEGSDKLHTTSAQSARRGLRSRRMHHTAAARTAPRRRAPFVARPYSRRSAP